jgi:hypothetical protein
MVGTASPLRPHLSLKARASRDIQLTANNWFNPYLLRSIVKFDRPMQVSVIGHGDCRLPQVASPSQYFCDFICTIKQAVLSMEVEMSECIGRHGAFTRLGYKPLI